MRKPKYLYLVISDKCRDNSVGDDVAFTAKAARVLAADYNKLEADGASDWRVVRYVMEQTND